MKMYYLLLLASVSFFGFFTGLFSSRSGREFSKIYEKKEIIHIETVRADCILMPESIDVITIRFDREDVKGECQYEVREEAERLIIREYIPDSAVETASDESRDKSSLSITVPQNTKVEFRSVSGSLRAEGLRADIDANTQTGDIDIASIKGNVSLQSATGKVVQNP